MQRGYDEAAATIVEGRIEDALGVDFVQMDEGRRCPVRLKVIPLHRNSFLKGSLCVTAQGVLRGRDALTSRPPLTWGGARARGTKAPTPRTAFFAPRSVAIRCRNKVGVASSIIALCVCIGRGQMA